MSPDVAITSATSADYPAACRALYPHVPEPERDARIVRTLALIAAGELDPSGLLVARIAGRPVGAVLTQRAAGNAGVIWPPRAEAGRHQSIVENALANAAVERFRTTGVKVVQAMTRLADRSAAEPLERAGFRHITRIVYLCRPHNEADRTGFNPATSTLQFEPVSDPSPVFAQTLMATYDNTLDCPELNGTRTADEVMAGYLSRGTSPDWTLIRHYGEPIGVIILAPGPEPGILDLSYLGLIPPARGKQFGTEMLRYILSRAEAEWVNLSVDERNLPALRLYRRHQFREFETQDVFLWRLT